MIQKVILNLVLVIMLTLSGGLFASENQKKPYTISLFGGGFLGNLEGSFNVFPLPSTYEQTVETAYNWTAGARINYELTDLFYISGGLAYKSVAGQYRVMDKNNESNYDSNRFILNYFSVPVVMRMGKGFYLGAGCYLAYQLGTGKMESQKNGVTADLPGSWNNKLDFGLIAEAGFVVKTPVELGLRLEYGLVNVIDKPADSSYGVKMKNINLMFMLGIELDLFN